jgi:hypothetical protein
LIGRANFTESVVEDAALAWLESLGYAIKHGRRSPWGISLSERQLVQKMQQFDSGAMCKKCILLLNTRLDPRPAQVGWQFVQKMH